jgi:hypothetical protein
MGDKVRVEALGGRAVVLMDSISSVSSAIRRVFGKAAA